MSFPGLLECNLKIFRGLKVNAQRACKSIHCLSLHSLKSLKNGVTKGGWVGGHLYKKGLEMWKKLKIKTRNYCVTLKNYYTLSEILIFCSKIILNNWKIRNAIKNFWPILPDFVPIFYRYWSDISYNLGNFLFLFGNLLRKLNHFGTI